ncbi:hypothetical protein [Psychrilyobacter sp.]|uniref:hypothetical protein n=1 Tax=Psychrilyobacter sp. TaxID=2586924 RepID=UPI003016F8A3
MSYKKLKITEDEARKEISKVSHETCKKGLMNNWEVENGKATFSSVCWLFMWATTGQGSKKAKSEARDAFNKIFEIGYDFLSASLTLEEADKYRYKQEIPIKVHQNILDAFEKRT